jgi:hypothetical protein
MALGPPLNHKSAQQDWPRGVSSVRVSLLRRAGARLRTTPLDVSPRRHLADLLLEMQPQHSADSLIPNASLQSA